MNNDCQSDSILWPLRKDRNQSFESRVGGRTTSSRSTSVTVVTEEKSQEPKKSQKKKERKQATHYQTNKVRLTTSLTNRIWCELQARIARGLAENQAKPLLVVVEVLQQKQQTAACGGQNNGILARCLSSSHSSDRQ